MDIHIALHSSNRKVFNNKNGSMFETCNTMDEFKCTVVNEISQLKRATYIMILFIKHLAKAKYEHRKQSSGCQGCVCTEGLFVKGHIGFLAKKTTQYLHSGSGYMTA